MSADTIAESAPAAEKPESAKSFETEEIVSPEIEQDNLARSLLYADHEILDDMVIGPTVLLRPVHRNWLPFSQTSLDEVSNYCKILDIYSMGSKIHINDSKIHAKHSEMYVKSSGILSEISDSSQFLSCDMRFTRKKKLKVHKCKRNKKMFSCEVCAMKFKHKSNLAKHKLVHKQGKPLSCGSNGQTFDIRNLFHQKSLQNNSLFRCEICGNRYKFLEHLVRHKSIHSKNKAITKDFHGKHSNLKKGEFGGSKKVFCQAGDQKPNQETASNKRKQNNVDNEDIALDTFIVSLRNKLSKLQTEISDKVIDCKATAIDDDHNKDFNFKQHTDSVKLKNSGSLKKIQSSSVKVPKSLEEQNFIASNTSDGQTFLTEHKTDLRKKKDQERSKKGERKPFKCDICGKGYTTKRILFQHKTIHSDIKPYSCEICKKYFNQISNLNQHNNTHHKKVKPYSCKFCTKQFSQKSHLNNHICRYHPTENLT